VTVNAALGLPIRNGSFTGAAGGGGDVAQLLSRATATIRLMTAGNAIFDIRRLGDRAGYGRQVAP